MATYSINKEHNGIEVIFDTKPARDVLDALKAEGFRWHNARRLWYAKNTEKRLSVVQKIAGGEKVEPASETPKKAANTAQKVNKYGVKVGDLFYSSWGYDQTNIDFFQVVALVGASSVRVREVFPRSERLDAYTDGSTRDCYYNDGKLLPPAPYSVHINDQERGDLKRLKSYAADGISNPLFSVASYANAYYVGSESIVLREDHGYR